jgi:citrate lyase beta subunit
LLNQARSLLFVPGDNGSGLAKALASEADAVVADLEDAVRDEAKPAARETIAATLAAPARPARMVRLNADGAELERDLHAVSGLELDALVIPKATPESVAALGADGPPILAIIETAIGLAGAREVAAAERVAALLLGGVDLSAELGLEPLEDGRELLYARSKLVVDSACAGVRAPFDAAHLRLHDVAGLEHEARASRALGMRGKICIHPDQVGTVNEVFATAGDVEWARATIAAYEAAEGQGAIAHDGEMVDLAVVARARRVLREAPAAQ